MSNDSTDHLVAALRSRIASAAPGTQLPATRTLVAERQVSPVTVQKALRVLVAQGLVETRPGVGTFTRASRQVSARDDSWQTAALGPLPPHQPTSAAMREVTGDVLSLHSGYPDRELLPERLIRAAMGRAARADSALAKPPGAGLPELRAWFAAELGAQCRPDVAAPIPGEVIVLPGSQSGLGSVMRTLLRDGSPILLESPTYWGAISAATQAGARIVPVPTSVDGPDPDVVDRAFGQSGATAFYVQPNFANPSGGQWSSQRAEQILEVARAHNAFLIEDDWAHDFPLTRQPTPLAAIDPSGHVVYLRSLTKSTSPALRIAAVIARGPVRERLLADRVAESMYVSGALQSAVLDVVTQPGWTTHLRRVSTQLRERRDLLIASLNEHAPHATLTSVPVGGLNLWVRLPDGTQARQVAAACEREGVIVAPGDEWFPAEPTAPHLRLNFAGPNPSAFPDAAARIGRALYSESQM